MQKPLIKLLVFIFVSLLANLSIKAQNNTLIDSLKLVYSNETDSINLVKNLLNIGDEFSHHNADSAMYYINKAISIGEKITYKEGLAEAFFMQSYYYDLKGDHQISISSLERATQLFEEVGDSSYLSGCYNNLGVLYSYGTNQKESIEYFIKSINIGEETKDSFSLAESYSNVADFYRELNEYSSALKYFKKALEIDIIYNNPEEIAISNLDVGYMNTKLMRFDEAIKNLEQAKILFKDINDPYFQAILYQGFAVYYNEINELDSAVLNINKAQEIESKFNFPMLKAEALSLKGEILLKHKEYKSSIATIDSAILKFKKLNTSTFLKSLYKNKAAACSELGWHNKAYENLQLADQTEQLAHSNQIAELLSEFEKNQALKEERARIKLEQDLEHQKNENDLIKVRTKLYFTINLTVLLGAILILALYLFFVKQKHNKTLESSYELINHQKELIEKSYHELKDNEKRLKQLNATKDKFFSIIAHDLKNPFNTLIGISELMISEPDIKHTEDFEELLQGMFQTAQSGHDLLENLLEWSRSQIGNISYEPQFVSLNEIFTSTIAFFSETVKAKNISIQVPDNINQKAYADYNMLNFIVRNLVNNAIKFSNNGGNIIISTSIKNENVKICIEDFGIGMKKGTIDKLFKIEHSVQRDGTNNEKGTGLGLILCKEFVEQNKGEIWVKSTFGEGSCFCITLPNSNR